MADTNNDFMVFKNKRELNAVLRATFKTKLIPKKLKETIYNNNVHIDFDITNDINVQQEITDIAIDFANVVRETLHTANVFLKTTKFGKQTFTMKKLDNYYKAWCDRSIVHVERNHTEYQTKKIMEDYVITNQVIDHWVSRFLPLTNSSLLKQGPMILTQMEHPILNNMPKKISFDLRKIEDQETYMILKYIEQKNLVRAYSQRLNDNVLWVDIDKDFDDKKFNKFMELLDYPVPLYIEKSNYSGGKHAYYIFDERIPDEFRIELEDWCENNGVRIECNWSKNFLQLIGSIDYSPIVMDLYDYDKRLRPLNQLNKAHLKYTMKKFIERKKDPKIVNSTEKLYSIVNGSYSKFDDILTYEEDIKEEPIKVKPKKSFGIIENYPVQYKNKMDNSYKHKQRDFIYAEAGNKTPALKNNIFACCDRGIFNNNEIRKFLIQYQGSSLTIGNVSDSDIDLWKSYYNRNFSSTSSVATKQVYAFISNKHILSKELKSFINRSLPMFKEAFVLNAKQFYKSNHRTHDLEIIAEELLYEVIGKFLFQLQNPEQAILPDHLMHLFKQELLTGFSLSVKFVDLLIKDLFVKQLITHSFDSRNLRDVFIKTFNLIPTFLYRNMNTSFYQVNEEIFNCNYNIKGLPIQFKFNSTTKQELEQELISNYLTPFINIESKVLSNIIHSLNTGDALNNKEIQLELKNKLLENNHFNYIYYVESKIKDNIDIQSNLSVNDPPDI